MLKTPKTLHRAWEHCDIEIMGLYGKLPKINNSVMRLKVLDMINFHLYLIVNPSLTSVTIAAPESMNSKIQKLKRLANGYRNVDIL